jgi:acetolactate synthase-1/2/3 large subunit
VGEQIGEWKRAEPLRYEWSDDVIKPQYVIEEISNITNGEASRGHRGGDSIRCGRPSTTRFKHPRTWCTSGGLGTMGYGLPTAMGVQAGNPGKLVVNIDGDGSFAMNSQELATCFEERLPVKTVLINNGGHGWSASGSASSSRSASAPSTRPSPDFVKLAGAYGCTASAPTKPSEVVPALEKMIATPGPCCWTCGSTRTSACSPWCPRAAPIPT